VAQLIGCKDRDLVFTSGGTESANFALFGSLQAQPERRVLVTTRIEHSAVRESAKRLENEGYEVLWLPNDEDGVIDSDALEDVLKERAAEIALVSVMWSNNETGVIQPIERLGALSTARRPILYRRHAVGGQDADECRGNADRLMGFCVAQVSRALGEGGCTSPHPC
jgi:cysteine desulfurase